MKIFQTKARLGAVVLVGTGLLALLLNWLMPSKKPAISPSAFVSITVYGANDSRVIGSDERDRLPRLVLQGGELKDIMSNCRYSNGNPVWKGARLGVAELVDGSTYDLRVSFYGGFFKIRDQEGYYVLQGDGRKAWDSAMEKGLLHGLGNGDGARKRGRG